MRQYKANCFTKVQKLIFKCIHFQRHMTHFVLRQYFTFYIIRVSATDTTIAEVHVAIFLVIKCFLMLFQGNYFLKAWVECTNYCLKTQSLCLRKYCTVPVCICPECILISTVIQVQNNNLNTSKKIETNILLSLMTFSCSWSSCFSIFLHNELLHWGILQHTQYFM